MLAATELPWDLRSVKAFDPRIVPYRRHLTELVIAATGAPFPHPGQIRALADRHRFRCVVKGRRGGGTTYGAVEILAELGLWSGLGYADVGIFAENSRKTELLWTRVWEALVEKQIYGPPARATRAPRYIEMPWGARVMAFSLGEDGPGEGYGYRLAVFDETQLIKRKVFDESIRPALGELGGRSLFIGKAKSEDFHALSRECEVFPDEWGTIRYRSVENPLFDPKEAEAAKRSLPLWLYEQEFEALFTDLGLSIFERQHVMACVLDDVLRPKPVSGEWYVDGWDLARKQDLTVGTTLGLTDTPSPESPAHVRATWAGHREPWPRITERINQRFRRWGSDRVAIDATGLGDVVSGYLEVPDAQRIDFIFSPKTKGPLITNLQTLVEHHSIRIPRDERLIAELIGYDWDDDDLETDRVMSLALAAWAAVNHGPRVRMTWLEDDGTVSVID